jgi:hypothetical protein
MYLKKLSKIQDSEYNNYKVKRLKVKVRKMYNKRTFGQPYKVDLKGITGSQEEGSGNIFTFRLTKRR